MKLYISILAMISMIVISCGPSNYAALTDANTIFPEKEKYIIVGEDTIPVEYSKTIDDLQRLLTIDDDTDFLTIEGSPGSREWKKFYATVLKSYVMDQLSSLGDVTITNPTSGQAITWNGSAWVNTTLAGAGDVTTAQLADSMAAVRADFPTDTDTQLSEEQVEDIIGGMLGGTETLISVTYNDAGGTIGFVVESNLSNYTNDAGFLTSESNNLTSAVTWANIPDANVPESAVTQHQAALSITESQISDLAYSIDNDTLETTKSINIGASVMPTSQTWLNIENELSIFSDGFQNSTNYFFGSLGGWSAAHGGAAYNLANNFHYWTDNPSNIRVEFENNSGPMQFYIEGINEAWYGLQNGSTHHWSFGYNAGLSDPSAIYWNNGFGLDATPQMRLTTSGDLYIQDQLGINQLSPNSSAALDIVSTSKGVLLPRMTTTQKNAISSPATSLLIFDTDLGSYQYYTGSAWASMSGGGSSAPSVSIDTPATTPLVIDLASLDRGIFNVHMDSLTNVTIAFSNPYNGGEYKLWFENVANDTVTFPGNFLSIDRNTLGSRKADKNALYKFFYDGTNYIAEDTIWVGIEIGDETAPILSSAYTQLGQDSVIVLKYNETLDNASTPAITDFTLSGGVGVSSVVVAGDSVVVYASSAYTYDSTITISYASGVNPIQDVAGNDASNLVDQAVTNNITGSVLVLDQYTGSVLGMGLRKLDEDYTGFCVEVRRSSDNTTQNIGFSGNDLDISALSGFCAGTNCYVRTLYGQDGSGRNAVQTTTTLQPQIVASGTIITSAGLPAMQFDGVDDILTIADTDALSATDGAGTDTPLSIFLVYELSSLGNQILFGKDAGGSNREYALGIFAFTQDKRFFIKSEGGANQQSYDDQSTAAGHIQSTMIYSGNESYTGIQFWNNGAPATMGNEVNQAYTGMSNTTAEFTIGGYVASSIPYSGKLQELLIWKADQTSNRTEIESRINSYYSIY